MAGSYIADRPEKPALVEGDAILIGDSTVTGAGSGKKHLPKQSATASSVALRTTGGQLKAADGVEDDDLVTMQQKAAESSKVVRLSRALAKDPDAGDTASIFADFKSQGFGVGSTDGIDEAKTDLELFNNFSRTSSGWRFNSRGQLEEVVAGIPRYNYNPATGEAEGLLIEEQRTNFFTDSQNPQNITQNIGGGTIELISGESTRRGGQAVGFRSELGSVALKNFRIVPAGIQVGDIVTYQLEVKKPEGSIVTGFTLSPIAISGGRLDIDLSNNTISNVTAGDNNLRNPFVKDLGDGYLLVGFTCDSYAVNTTLRVFVSSGGGSYEGTGDIDLIFGTPQVERGNNATSYIPTNGTAVTRTADIVARTLGAEFNPNEGTFVVEWEVGAFLSSGGAIFSVGSATTDRLMFQITSSGAFAFVQDSAISSTVPSGLPRDIMRVAFSYSIGNPSRWSYNGLPTISLGAAKLPFLNNPRVAVGDRAWALGSDTYVGKFKLVKYEPRAVSDTELQELSRL